MFRHIRIAILLTILAIITGNQWLTKDRFSSWEKPLWVTIYPVLAEPGDSIRHYAESLDEESFAEIGSFFEQQAKRFGHQLQSPVIVQVARPLTAVPPALPAESSGFNVALWSLKMRWWVWRNSDQHDLGPEDIKMFVLFQGSKPAGLMERSVGIQNGGYGIVNAEASRRMAARNLIVITHELMHILGASDKYDLTNGQPIPPEGLANPSKSPIYPQSHAEIMGGRIAISADRWQRPATLKSCVVGPVTAIEIGWL